MIRVTFDLLPGGREEGRRTIGIAEISNIGTRKDGTADYAVVLTKTPPFKGALREAWRKGLVVGEEVATDCAPGETDEMLVGRIEGHHRTRRGVYDLLYRALVACGIAKRNRGYG